MEGWDRPASVHALMAMGCLSSLDKKLRFNICKLEDASRLNKDPIVQRRVRDHVTQEHEYAALFYWEHVRSSEAQLSQNEVALKLTELLHTEKALYWLEVMSLIDAIDKAITILSEISHPSVAKVGHHLPYKGRC